MDVYYHIGWCPICNQGWVDVVKNAADNALLLYCNECDSTWDNPLNFKSNIPEKFEAEGYIVAVSLTEIKEAGWDKWLFPTDSLFK